MVCKGGILRAAGALLLGCALQQLQLPARAQGIYTCVDSHGRTLTADRPIPECADREQKELSPTGALRRSIGPSLSEREQAEREARERAQAEERRRQGDEKRRERALVNRYPNQAAHDAERSAALKQIDEVIAAANQRIVELQSQRKALDTEMEFYAKDPAKAPESLKRKYTDNDSDVQAQRRFIEDQQQERQRVNARFDAELAKLRQLWAQQTAVR
ncbi:DUF4124 domain-containing protein [Ramlibacter sp. H39-3-26]|uniref:DUF4124 domain-containing protein n=1 Tax=Curvibacter soli TaxID=3031331 RepID=UPI0023DA8F4D|nr:DUF4124 domain-containing protein [Ramlibacter sp. H39-3-26]MDF1486092.1 DUF4124 domain-containing protein [Ramlibacter sp. H39-3-26]